MLIDEQPTLTAELERTNCPSKDFEFGNSGCFAHLEFPRGVFSQVTVACQG